MRPSKSAMLIGLATVTLLASAAVAQSSAAHLLLRSVIGGGGGRSVGGGSSLHGTIGQPATGLSSGTLYRLSGGFWWPGAAPQTPGAGTLEPSATAPPTASVSSTATTVAPGTGTTTPSATVGTATPPGPSPTAGAGPDVWLPIVGRGWVVVSP